MVKLTKAQRKQQDIIQAWVNGMPFKMSSRDKFGTVPALSTEEVLTSYIPEHGIAECGKFYTPLSIATQLWQSLPHAPQYILEPSAGIGNLLYPIQQEYHDYPDADQPVSVTAYEFDSYDIQIGIRLFPWANWINASPFDHWYEIEGKYDTVLMNPPFGTSIRSVSIEYDNTLANIANGKCKAAEHLFLMLAINALKPGGVALVIAPYSFHEKLPKKLAPWVEERVSDFQDLGQLDGDFSLTGIKVHGWLIERNGFGFIEPDIKETPATIPVVTAFVIDDETPAPGFVTTPEIIVEDETPAPAEPTPAPEQSMLNFMPSSIPEPIDEGEISLTALLDRLDEKSKDWKLKPTSEFVESVRRWGVRDAVILFQAHEDDHYTLSLKAGRRRIQAAIEVGLEKIRYKIYPASMGSIAANALAIDDNATRRPNPVYELEVIMELMAEAKERGILRPLSDISQITGMSVPTIQKRLRLQALPASIITGVKDGTVSKSVAESIVSEPASIRNALASKLATTGKLTTADVSEIKQARAVSASEALTWGNLGTVEKQAQYVHLVIQHFTNLEQPSNIIIAFASTDKEKAKEVYGRVYASGDIHTETQLVSVKVE